MNLINGPLYDDAILHIASQCDLHTLIILSRTCRDLHLYLLV